MDLVSLKNKENNFLFPGIKKGKRNKKYLTLFCMLFLAGIFFLFLGTSVFAQDPIDPGLAPLANTGLSSEDPRIIVAKLIRVFLGFLGIIGLVICVYAGYLWMTSQGDEAKVERAKQLLVNGAIGLFIILASYAIVSYVIHLLLTGIANMQGGPPPDRDNLGRGALGAGVIQSHYPPRDATGIPRNTNIIITFKVPMDLDSIAKWEDDGDGKQWDDTFRLWFGDVDTSPDGTIGPDSSEFSLEISLLENSDRLFDARVYVLESEFNNNEIKTIVIDPDDSLGSPTEEFQHKVELKGGTEFLSGIRTKAGQEPFQLFSYVWDFETSIVLDFTPPLLTGMQDPGYLPQPHAVPLLPSDPNDSDFQTYQAKRDHAGVIPFPYVLKHPCNDPMQARDTNVDGEPDLCRTWPRNTLIQINFNEAVNPIAVAGVDSSIMVYANRNGIQGGPDVDDDSGDWIAVPGEWRMSSDYTSIEFWPALEDGVNSCGEKIFILPGPSVLRVYILAATPQDPDPASPNYTPQRTFPFDGVVDVASNALDGNADTFATSGYVNGQVDGIFDDNLAIPPTPYNLVDDDFDDFVFVFDTSSEIDLTSPLLTELEPDDQASYVSVRDPFKAEFNKFMSATSLLGNDTVVVWGKEEDPDHPGTPWERCTDGCNIAGTLINYISTTLLDGDDDGESDHHGVNIVHETLQTEPSTVYAPILTKGIKDLYQNCYEGACKNVGVDTHGKTTPVTDPYDPNSPGEEAPTSAGCTAYEP